MDYSDYGRTLEGIPCVSIKDEFPGHPVEWDDSLIGEKGEIWPDHRGGYRAVVFGLLCDKVFSFEKQALRKWKDELKVPFSAYLQVGLHLARRKGQIL